MTREKVEGKGRRGMGKKKKGEGRYRRCGGEELRGMVRKWSRNSLPTLLMLHKVHWNADGHSSQ